MQKNTKTPNKKKPFPIVGIGSSAGGLEALEIFFDHMPSDQGIAFVVIQHLSPDHKSIMKELLQKHTKMKVLQTEDGMKIQPNHLYLNPPAKNISLFNGRFCLSDPELGHVVRLSIDYFFRSLAEDQKERAICIILSGTGSDGTLGIRAIKAEGGMSMVQDKEQAKYSGMPSKRHRYGSCGSCPAS